MIDSIPTAIPDVRVLSSRWFEDERGAFSETWNRHRSAEAGLDIDFVQDNHVVSAQKGTLRGLHFQRSPHAQAKLIRVLRGAIFDVALDIRKGSPWFGRWVGVELSASNRLQLFVPAGFAHGYVTLEDQTEVLYKVDDYWSKDDEGGLPWNDPDLAIDWPELAEPPVVAARDGVFPRFADFETPFVWTPPS